MANFPLCSDCFRDQGLKLDAIQIGASDDGACPNCGLNTGLKLTREAVLTLAYRFFDRGTLERVDYGAAPLVVFNEHQKTNIQCKPWTEPDLHLIERVCGVGFFLYGPNLWMLGEIEPLKQLQSAA